MCSLTPTRTCPTAKPLIGCTTATACRVRGAPITRDPPARPPDVASRVCVCVCLSACLPTCLPVHADGEGQGSHRLIEELALIANRSVAEWLAKCPLPEPRDLTLLRTQLPPDEAHMRKLRKLCLSRGVPMDVSSASALQASLRLLREEQSEAFGVFRPLACAVVRSHS